MYEKKDAVMTQGLAILTMLLLHLFCRKGNDVYGTPLLWINSNTPVVYLFGFFSEICVPLFSICAGYAQCILMENGKQSWNALWNRILKLLVNCWVVLAIFAAIGVVSHKEFPASLSDFLANIFLLKTYNGSWWYVKTYILLLLSFFVVYKLARNVNPNIGIFVALLAGVAQYIAKHFLSPYTAMLHSDAFIWLWNETSNYIYVLPSFLLGVFLCRGKVLDRINRFICQRWGGKKDIYLCILLAVVFGAVCAIEEAIVMDAVALIVFIIFNLLYRYNYYFFYN